MMEKKDFTLVFVIAIGFLIGFIIFTKQEGGNSQLSILMQQQAKMMSSQNNLEKLMTKGAAVGSGDTSALKSNIANLTAKLQALETKFAKVETDLNNHLGRGRAVGGGGSPSGAAGRPDPGQVQDIPVEDTPVYGDKKAKVTIVEFVDFQCPFCARFHPPLVEAVDGYSKNVNYMIKNFPLSFHPQAKPAAKAALAAGEQGKYFEMSSKLLENGKSLSDEKFEEIAKEIGLNVKKFIKDYKNKDAEYEKIIQRDITLGGKVGVRGTPSFFINGRVTSARDAASFKREIDQILNKK